MTDLTPIDISTVSDDSVGMGYRQVFGKLLRQPSFVIGAGALTLIVLIAVFAPMITPHDPLTQDLASSLRPPFWNERGSLEHPLGTDTLGRDIASRLIYGARNSLIIAFFAVNLSAILGLAAGLVAGFAGGWWDSLIMRLGDMQLAFPFILLAIIVLGINPDRNIFHLIGVLGIPGWILYARVVRSRVLAERDKDYVTAAKAIGANRIRQMWKYVLPSVWRVVLVIALLDFGFIILVEATLSFLGFGLTPPTPSWGGILADGRKNIIIAPWLAIFPGVAILVSVLAINLTADAAADVFDPRLKKGVLRRIRQLFPAEDGTEAQKKRKINDGNLDNEYFLEVRNLSVAFPLDDRVVQAVRNVSFTLNRGETLGIVGESGSGKSVTASAIIQLIESPGRVTNGEILFEGHDLTRISNKAMARLRGGAIGMIFQNPTSSLNPVLSIGSQMVETIRQHRQVTPTEAKTIALEALHNVGIGDSQGVFSRYPFQLSGGMNQRVMIALAMLAEPELMIADEPTTSLDVTTQAQVLDQLSSVIQERNTALILITHDIALVREYADHVVVLYAGQVCESGPVDAVIRSPQHPYTKVLIESVPRADLEPGERLPAIPGELPNASETLVGCPFAPRCPYMMDVCREIDPPLESVGLGRVAACHLDTIPTTLEEVS